MRRTGRSSTQVVETHDENEVRDGYRDGGGHGDNEQDLGLSSHSVSAVAHRGPRRHLTLQSGSSSGGGRRPTQVRPVQSR